MVTATNKRPDPKNVLSSAAFKEIERKADALATKLEGSDELTKEFEIAIETDFRNKLTTSAVHFSLFEMFEPEEIALWPRFGAIEGYTGNDPYDVFTYRNLDGKEETTSFWRLTAKRHKIDLAYQKQLKMIEDAGKGVKNKYDNDHMSEGERGREKEDIGGKRTTFYGKLKLAVELYFAMIEANDKLGKVLTVDYATVPVMENGAVKMEKGEPVIELDRKSPRIIKVKDKIRDTSKYFTIPNFLRLDANIALAKGGTYGDFITSNKREQPEDEQPDETKHITIGGPKDVEDGTIAFVHYMNGVKSKPTLMSDLVKYYTATDGSDRRDTLFRMVDLVSMLTENQKIKDMYTNESNGNRPAVAA